MTVERMKSVLMVMSMGERYDEMWFVGKGKCSKEELQEMVENGYLTYIEKDPNDFMSDNGYLLTDAGCELAWGR